MSKITVRLIKPLNGAAPGSEAEYDKRDADRLVKLGAVELIEAPAKPKPAKKAKAAPAPINKMEQAPQNKADDAATSPPAGGAASTEDETKG